MVDKRKYPRLDAHVLVLSVLGLSKSDNFQFKAKDISLEGISFYASTPVNPDDIIELKITLPIDPEPIKAVAKVIWTTMAATEDDLKYIAGVRFIEINEKRLNEIITQLNVEG